MKKIKLHGMTADNAGDHHDAGAVLTVSDDVKHSYITAARASALVAIRSAEAVDEKAPKAADAE